MASKFFLVKSLVRRALQNPDYSWRVDLAEARLILEALHAGQYTSVEDPAERATRMRTQMGGKSFEWSVPDSLTKADILELAERALEWIERCETVDEARAILTRRKNTRTDYSGFRLS